jgi:hypothetical protein
MPRISFCLAVCLVVVVATGCATTPRKKSRFARHPKGATTAVSDVDDTAAPVAAEPPPPPMTVRFEDRDVTLDVAGAPAVLKASVALPVVGSDAVTGPVIVIVPGASDVSRKGMRRGDGVTTYAAPIAVTTSWQQAFGERGALSLAWDKRTCGPNDDPGCNKNPQADVDEKGPGALAADVDAACALARTLPGSDGRIVLFAHGQATQVALSSTCAADAAAVVLLNPIPREIDAVLVDALNARQEKLFADAKAAASPEEKTRLQDQAVALRNLAATRQAGFASMTSGKFARDARVDGATIGFWLGWIELTKKTTSLMKPLKDKTIVVVSAGDQQLSEADRDRARALPAKAVIEVTGDHHLVADGVLSAEASTAVIDAVVDLVTPPAS